MHTFIQLSFISPFSFQKFLCVQVSTEINKHNKMQVYTGSPDVPALHSDLKAASNPHGRVGDWCTRI